MAVVVVNSGEEAAAATQKMCGKRMGSPRATTSNVC
jgi:hypothetical protein